MGATSSGCSTSRMSVLTSASTPAGAIVRSSRLGRAGCPGGVHSRASGAADDGLLRPVGRHARTAAPSAASRSRSRPAPPAEQTEAFAPLARSSLQTQRDPGVGKVGAEAAVRRSDSSPATSRWCSPGRAARAGASQQSSYTRHRAGHGCSRSTRGCATAQLSRISSGLGPAALLIQPNQPPGPSSKVSRYTCMDACQRYFKCVQSVVPVTTSCWTPALHGDAMDTQLRGALTTMRKSALEFCEFANRPAESKFRGPPGVFPSGPRSPTPPCTHLQVCGGVMSESYSTGSRPAVVVEVFDLDGDVHRGGPFEAVVDHEDRRRPPAAGRRDSRQSVSTGEPRRGDAVLVLDLLESLLAFVCPSVTSTDFAPAKGPAARRGSSPS